MVGSLLALLGACAVLAGILSAISSDSREERKVALVVAASGIVTVIGGVYLSGGF